MAALLLLPPPRSLLFGLLLFLFFLLHLSADSHVAAATRSSFAKTTSSSSSHSSPAADVATGKAAMASPFTAKAALIRYWNRKVPTNRPQPEFLLSKLSPLSALDSATFSSLAAAGPAALSARLPALCSAARLLCLPDHYESSARAVNSPSSFSGYQTSNFSNYGTAVGGGLTAFKNYSQDFSEPNDSFRRYSRDSVGHNDSFTSYEPGGNVVTANFTSYATSATGGAGDFSKYQQGGNVPSLQFTNYEADANGRLQSFSGYSDQSNAGDQSFAGYGKNGNGVSSSFLGYGNDTNVIGSTFAKYGESANGANDNFTSYGFNGNVPENNFRSYGDSGNGAKESFTSYRDQSNVGDDSFSSYAKGGNAATADFTNYGNSFNPGSDTFKGYGDGGSSGHEITFTTYAGENNTFKSYAKSGIDFKGYRNASSVPEGAVDAASLLADRPTSTASAAEPAKKRPAPNHWLVEPGKFFRERELRKGNVMPMPDIRDKMAPRSFLPRSIAGRIPFAAGDVRRAFNTPEDTAMGKAIASTVAECVRAPSRGETKRCATSAEDVIDFAVSVLGSDVVVRSTASEKGGGGSVAIGEVKGVNGGRVTRSVSCHQSLFPYLVYYCHSVPKVRVYEAEILTADSKHRINRGVAICHLDTSDWSPRHGAFVSLGSAPGQIEVCHWIFQGDMTWTVAD